MRDMMFFVAIIKNSHPLNLTCTHQDSHQLILYVTLGRLLYDCI